MFIIAQEEQNKNYKRGEFDIATPTLLCAVSPNGNIAWGNSSVYELHILDPEGKRIRKIQKAHSPLAITAKEKEGYEKEYSEVLASGGKLNFPGHFPAFMNIFVDDQEWLWVKAYERVEGEEDSYYFDIFDAEGKYIAKVPIRVNLDQSAVWKEKVLYTIKTGKEGFQRIKRFRVRWKIQGIAS